MGGEALLLVVALLAGGGVSAQGTGATAEAHAGRAVALHSCAVCHTVAGPQRKPVWKPAAPDFRVIANRPETTEESLLAFLATRHRSVPDWREMPGVKTTAAEDRAVVAYILSLRKAGRMKGVTR